MAESLKNSARWSPGYFATHDPAVLETEAFLPVDSLAKKLRRLSTVGRRLKKAAGSNSGGLFLDQVVFEIASRSNGWQNVGVRV
jgi:hypothetical protein